MHDLIHRDCIEYMAVQPEGPSGVAFTAVKRMNTGTHFSAKGNVARRKRVLSLAHGVFLDEAFWDRKPATRFSGWYRAILYSLIDTCAVNGLYLRCCRGCNPNLFLMRFIPSGPLAKVSICKQCPKLQDNICLLLLDSQKRSQLPSSTTRLAAAYRPFQEIATVYNAWFAKTNIALKSFVKQANGTVFYLANLNYWRVSPAVAALCAPSRDCNAAIRINDTSTISQYRVVVHKLPSFLRGCSIIPCLMS